MQIHGATAIITGGASGMGAATAAQLRKQGANIALLDLNIDAAREEAKKLQGIAIACDVSDEASVQTALSMIQEKFSTPSICVNCAGIVHGRRMLNKEGPMPLTEFKRVIDINLVGTFNVMRLVAAAMASNQPDSETGERGVIVNTASVAAFEGQIGQTAYGTSKAAIVGLTLPAARELSSLGIRVMAIAPGLVDTPMFAKISEEARTALAASVPFPKRLARPEEYAMLVQQIIENPMLNGEVIRLDGALRMQPK